MAEMKPVRRGQRTWKLDDGRVYNKFNPSLIIVVTSNRDT